MIRFMKTVSLLTAAYLLMTPVVPWAGDGSGDAGQPGEYLFYGTSVRSLGLGRTYVALADNAAAVFHNPAGLLETEKVWDFYFMHFDPFYASRYNAVAAAYSRPDRASPGGLRGFFLGPHSALGLGYIDHGSGDYEFRGASDQFYGTFGLRQSALYAAFARRDMLSIGHIGNGFVCKIDYGVAFKMTRQEFADLSGYNADFGSGLDAGIQLQFIHPKPITDVIPLRLLLPLRIGVAVQNVFLRPHMGFGRSSDKFPTIYKVGFSYLANVSTGHHLLVVGDAVKQNWGGRSYGWHLGTEWQMYSTPVPIFVRGGGYYQSGTWRFTAGLGIKTTIKGDLGAQIDFAHEFRSNLDDDQRFAVSLVYGVERNAQTSLDRARNRRALTIDPELNRKLNQAKNADDSLKIQKTISYTAERSGYLNALEALSCYPYRNDAVYDAGLTSPVIRAAVTLGDTLDVKRQERYAQFIGQGYYACQLVRSGRDQMRAGESGSACDRADKAIAIFASDSSHLSAEDRLYWAEAYLIKAENDSIMAAGFADRALGLLSSLSAGPVSDYFSGRCLQHNKQWPAALMKFMGVRENLPSGRDTLDLRKLSLIGTAECLEYTAAGDSATLSACYDTLDLELNGYSKTKGELDTLYLPYPRFADKYVADDALYWMAVLCRAGGCAGRPTTYESLLSDQCRLYPILDRCRSMEKGVTPDIVGQ